MKITKAVVDSDLRTRVFSAIFDEFTNDAFKKINDRQYGIILTDKNGVERYVRIGAIVAEEREDMTAEEREDMTARELMEKEINDYKEKQKAKAQKEKEKQEKIVRDKEKREKEKEGE